MHPQSAMPIQPLSPAQRKARLDALVAQGKLSREQAAHFRLDEPIPEVIQEEARAVAPLARRALAPLHL
jgi:hypothetical protein